jgi:mitochondrial fission protein ELM1
LTGEDPQGDRELAAIAEALGGRMEEKRLAFGARAGLPGRALGGLDRSASSSLEAPWPDLVLMAGRRALPVARWVREQSGGRTRLVQLGRPGGAFELVDLIVARPDDRLPVRPNVIQVAGPLVATTSTEANDESLKAGPFAGLAHPILLLLLTGRLAPYSLTESGIRALGTAAAAEARRQGGSLAVCSDGTVAPKLLAELRSTAGGGVPFIEASAEDAVERSMLLRAADRYLVTAGDAEGLAEVCPTGKPVALYDLPRWYDELPVVQPMVRFVLPILGGNTYRGTPLQQHLPGRFMDWLATRGLLFRARDLEALYRSLEGRGLLHRLGAEERIATPKPLDDLEQVAGRVRRLLGEVTSRAA